MSAIVRTLALVFIVALLSMAAVAEEPAQEKAPKSDEPSSQQQAPKNPPPPRSSPGRDPNSSSSRENIIDLSPPPGDRGSHPERPPAADSDVTEMHPYDPHQAEKHIEVGDFYFKRGNYKAAVSRYREALEWKPNDAVATFRLAQGLEKNGEIEEAYKHYQTYLQILPEGPSAEEAKKARSRLEPHLEIRSGPLAKRQIERDLEVGRDMLKQKKYDSALLRFREVLELDPQNPNGLFWLAKTLEAKGERAEARQHYYTYLRLYADGEHGAEAKAALARLSTEPHPSTQSRPTSQSAQTPR
ncbi:MAG TPA: tetratricopeptide repeat protein [Terriglobales bacterium]|nr:tetratricopeptide repeat protein [Terriglobales bacterium]